MEIKKWTLCKQCYSRLYQRNQRGNFRKGDFTPGNVFGEVHGWKNEMEFIKIFFNHKNWIYEPAMFKSNGFRYTPDFYDGERNVFIEVAGTRQAFSDNKEKYIQFREIFPKITLEVRNTKGTLIDIEKGYTEK